jgi:hypothetical protein
MLGIKQIEPAIPNKRKGLFKKIVLLQYDIHPPNPPPSLFRPQQQRQFEISSSRFRNFTLTISTSHSDTFIPSVHLMGHYVVAGLAVIKKWKKRLMNNLNTYSPMESRSFWTSTESVWDWRDTKLKNNRAVMYISLSSSLVKVYCLHFWIYLRTSNPYKLVCSSSQSFVLITAPLVHAFSSVLN